VFAASANSNRGTHASLPTKDNTLTAEQTAALRAFRARWTTIWRSTEPADRDAAEEGARLAYRAAALKPPARFVWCEGPVALSHLTQRISRADGANVKSAVIDRLHRQAASLVGRRISKHVQAAIASVVSPADALLVSAAEAVMRGLACDTVSLLERVRQARALSWNLRPLFAQGGFRSSVAGQHDLLWLGTYDYVRNVPGLQVETEPLVGLWLLARSLGWMQLHEHTCWLAERPNLLRGDARDRLHSAKGPALQYPDGWSVWTWKGVEVPQWIIEQPESVTLAAIDGEPDVQVRRCMIEIVTPQRYVALGGAVRVAEDDAGILWRKVWWASDAWAAVEVVNATPEPDGTRRHFFPQVPANMRTAREAVAWTYGLRENAYAGLVVRT
jgi:Domain of unknown function (DUF6745)